MCDTTCSEPEKQCCREYPAEKIIEIKTSQRDKNGQIIRYLVKGCPFRRGEITNFHYYCLRLFTEQKEHHQFYMGLPPSEQLYVYIQAMRILYEEYGNYMRAVDKLHEARRRSIARPPKGSGRGRS